MESCITSPRQPKDRWRSNTAFGLCADTGAADAQFGKHYEDAGGVVVADIVQVNRGARWNGTADPTAFVDWSPHVTTPGQVLAVGRKEP